MPTDDDALFGRKGRLFEIYKLIQKRKAGSVHQQHKNIIPVLTWLMDSRARFESQRGPGNLNLSPAKLFQLVNVTSHNAAPLSPSHRLQRAEKLHITTGVVW